MGHTVLLFIGHEENQRGETERRAAAGFVVELACSSKTRQERGEKTDGTGLAKNPEVNARGSVENRRRNCRI